LFGKKAYNLVMATTIRIEEQTVTITNDHKSCRGKAWTGTIDEALSAWIGKKFSRFDTRTITRRDIANAQGTFKPFVRQTIID
jgi:hypothetical protein